MMVLVVSLTSWGSVSNVSCWSLSIALRAFRSAMVNVSAAARPYVF